MRTQKIFFFVLELLSMLFFRVGQAQVAPMYQGQTCVLIFERDKFPLTKAIRKIYDGAPHTDVRTYATPKDILDCVQGGAKEVIVVAHLVQLGQNGPSRLGYFQNDSGKDSLHLVIDHPFQELVQILKNQQAQNQMSLQKFRLMSCGPGEVLQDYPAFQDLKTLVDFDQAPKSSVASFIENAQAVSFNKEWFSKDFDCATISSPWQTNLNAYCKSDSWSGCDRATARYCLPTGG